MLISGKKIVRLTIEERDALASAMEVLNSLSEALGNDEFYDFEDLSDTLCYIYTTDKFEMDFEQ